MNAKILEVVKADKAISAFVEINGESTWMTAHHITECVSESFMYFGYDMPDATVIWGAIDSFKALCKAKAEDGLSRWADMLSLIAE